ncbi:MAG: primosomal protein N' [Gammaproteobacteria bacterium]|nr:MAG: primosomal protein N' [Gammaproteobacteria bacterium]
MSDKPAKRFASFAIAIPIYRIFDYAIEPGKSGAAGSRYRLPFGQGYKTGLLLEKHDSTSVPGNRIKAAGECLDDEPVLSEHMIRLARWIANYYLQPLGEVLFQCLPGYLRGSKAVKPDRVKYWQAKSIDAGVRDKIERRSPRQFELLVAIERSEAGLNAVQLKAINQGWHGLIRALEEKDAIKWGWLTPTRIDHSDAIIPDLSAEQEQSYSQIKSRSDRFSVHLLDGITGSGKTEVYFRLIQDALSRKQQVIYLVPEIGLTSQLVDRVRKRFGEQFTISHSALTERQRYHAWDRFRRGDVGIMLGTRSSLFSQNDRLGLIVIDEEHDHSYKQEDGIRYHARDVAIKRAQMLDIPILLGSATPSLESLNNCAREHYFYYQLSQRPTGFAPPRIQLIDSKNLQLDSGCSPALLQRIDYHLGQKGQVLLYLNRRGFAPVVMCHECGWQANCAHCDSRLTLHQFLNRLLCHHCGYAQALPGCCGECGNPDIKHYGIGTEQLEQGLKKRFPDYPVLRIDRDVIASRDDLDQRLATLRLGEPCLLIGTQMIAKGHDYPGITMSAILDTDQALFSASYRASERLVQTAFQVSGRSGRGDRQGEAYLQTSFCDHPLMQSIANQSYREIAESITRERKMLGFPPYARVVMFRADALSLDQAIEKLNAIKQCLQASVARHRVKCIGPIPALMTRRIGRYRGQLCLLSQDIRELRNALREAMPEIELIKSTAVVKWVVDVDALDL